MERQRTEITRLWNLLDLTGAGKVLCFDFGSGSVVLKSNCLVYVFNLWQIYLTVPDQFHA